jgi:hypothetical protein
VSAAAELLTSLELCPELEWDLMHETEIYKALKQVGDLSSIPGERADALRRRCAALFDELERRRRLDSKTPSTTDQESMTHSEVADGGNASKSENRRDMGEVSRYAATTALRYPPSLNGARMFGPPWATSSRGDNIVGLSQGEKDHGQHRVVEG